MNPYYNVFLSHSRRTDNDHVTLIGSLTHTDSLSSLLVLLPPPCLPSRWRRHKAELHKDNTEPLWKLPNKYRPDCFTESCGRYGRHCKSNGPQNMKMQRLYNEIYYIFEETSLSSGTHGCYKRNRFELKQQLNPVFRNGFFFFSCFGLEGATHSNSPGSHVHVDFAWTLHGGNLERIRLYLDSRKWSEKLWLKFGCYVTRWLEIWLKKSIIHIRMKHVWITAVNGCWCSHIF